MKPKLTPWIPNPYKFSSNYECGRFTLDYANVDFQSPTISIFKIHGPTRTKARWTFQVLITDFPDTEMNVQKYLYRLESNVFSFKEAKIEADKFIIRYFDLLDKRLHHFM